jgi:two-component system, OmpR family, response regulator RegX3
VTRVLVVEDEESYSDALAYMLRKEGFEVSLAATGPDALTEFDRTGADIVLLDLMLPGLSGTEVCRQIRTSSNVPVIMVSAKDAEVDKVVGLELGADDYVTKPFSIRELLARVRAILRRTEGAKKRLSRYRFSDIELDFETYRAKRGGEPLDLSPREFELLRYLIERKGETVSRDRLLEDVWGYESYPSTRTVDTHIAKLRAKIGDSGSEPRFIMTIHGTGYKFVDPS